MRSKKHDLPFEGTWKHLFATIYSTITRTSYQLLSHITAKIDTSGRQSIDKKSLVGRLQQFAKWTKTVTPWRSLEAPKIWNSITESNLRRSRICAARFYCRRGWASICCFRWVNLILEQFLIVSFDCQLQFGMRLIESVGCRKLAENDGSSRGQMTQRWLSLTTFLINLTLIRKTQEVVSKVNWSKSFTFCWIHWPYGLKFTKMHRNKWESKPKTCTNHFSAQLNFKDSWPSLILSVLSQLFTESTMEHISWWAWTEFMHFSCYWSDFCFDFFS